MMLRRSWRQEGGKRYSCNGGTVGVVEVEDPKVEREEALVGWKE